MTKSELIKAMAEEAGITKVQANAAFDKLVTSISQSLKKGQKFSLAGIGTFSVKKRNARKGRNPLTGESIKIKAKKVAKFKATKSLSEIL